VVRTGRRTVKGVAGYDLTHLFVGSEGTLGVITEATLSLRPAAARPHTFAALFTSVPDAAAVVAAIVAAGHVPSLLELMDATTVRAVNAHLRSDLPEDCGALLLAQSDVSRAEVSAMAAIASDGGAFLVVEADSAAEGETLLAARRAVMESLEALGTTLIDDVCVPLTRLADLVTGCEAIAASHGLTIGVLGHAGDGNMHPTVVFDESSPAQVAAAEAAFGEIMALGLGLGGTITGEHGVGVLKREWLERELGPAALNLHRTIKAALDPLGLLNPGKVLARG
jgi:glycolate oxidase